MTDRIKVGVVSSHVDTVTGICNYLEGRGFKSSWVYNNNEVIDLCKREDPDVVIINVSEERPEGFNVAAEISDKKVIFMSADDLEERARKVKNFAGFIKKPVDLEDVVEKVKSIFKSRKAGKEKKHILVIL